MSRKGGVWRRTGITVTRQDGAQQRTLPVRNTPQCKRDGAEQGQDGASDLGGRQRVGCDEGNVDVGDGGNGYPGEVEGEGQHVDAPGGRREVDTGAAVVLRCRQLANVPFEN